MKLLKLTALAVAATLAFCLGNPAKALAGMTLTVDPTQVGPTMSVNDLGAGLGIWYNLTLPGIASGFEAAGLKLTRYTDGNNTDTYHWHTGTTGPAGTPCATNANSASTLDAAEQDIIIPANLSLALETNYGSDPTCTTGADPNDTAGWLSYIEQQGYSVVSATVGNEQYTPGAIDCRQSGCKSSQDPVQYATNEQAFYNAYKLVDPNLRVFVDANMASPTNNNWNPYLFAHAKYDGVEIHYYPQASGAPTDDNFLLYTAIPQMTSQINVVKQELADAGHPNAKIYIGEIANGLGPYGTQSQSIVNALYAGMAIGEAETDGVSQMTWHIAHGSCQTPANGGDFTDSYGSQTTWAGAAIFADKVTNNCPTTAPVNALLPVANAFLEGSYFVHAGEKMVGATVSATGTGASDVRAYAGTYQGGYALMLFDLNETIGHTVTVTINGKNSGSGGTIVTYDKAAYDQSSQGVWAAPTVTTFGSWSGSFQVRLTPWSMVVVQVQ